MQFGDNLSYSENSGDQPVEINVKLSNALICSEDLRIQHCKNKMLRSKMFNKMKNKKKKSRKAIREGRDPDGAKEVPKTIENMRQFDVNIVDDEESTYAATHDEHTATLTHIQKIGFDRSAGLGKLLITCSLNSPSKRVFRFCKEIERVFTGSLFIKRQGRYTLEQIVNKMNERGFTDLLVVNKGVSALLNDNGVGYSEEDGNVADSTTKGKWIPYCPLDAHKQVVLREGEEPKKVVALRELGPRMSLKLISVRKGAFDFANGEYLWLFNRHEMEKSRRQFQL